MATQLQDMSVNKHEGATKPREQLPLESKANITTQLMNPEKYVASELHIAPINTKMVHKEHLARQSERNSIE